MYDRVVVPCNARRDFIVIEIRGTGFAEPKLDCPEMEASEPGLRACREQLALRADVSQYHSANVRATWTNTWTNSAWTNSAVRSDIAHGTSLGGRMVPGSL
jgi:hypothetical protein